MDSELAEKIEAKRSELEVNIANLRKSLHHWTSLELDYESLKDEFRGLRDGATKDDCLDAAHNSGIQTVDEKELNDLIEPSRGKLRSPAQLVEVLSKRVEYVLRNTETLKKQISDLEKRRNAVLLAAHPELEADAGLPLSEITEELDDHGNILSSNVQHQGDTAKKVLDVLDKSNVNSAEGSSLPKPSLDSNKPRIEEVQSSDEDSDIDELHNNTVSSEANKKSTEVLSSQISENYVINPDDTEEEARLRQEMIQYGLGEVGNIVAELDMVDQETSDPEDNDEDMDDELDEIEGDEYDEDSAEDDSEDETGRSRSNYSDKYRSQMEKLQNQLGLQLENVGPDAQPTLDTRIQDQISYLRGSEFNDQIAHLPPEFKKRFGRLSPAEAARKAALAREEATRNAQRNDAGENDGGLEKNDGTKNKKKKKKQVAFASSVDIAPNPSNTTLAVMKDTISEHNVTQHETSAASTPSKVSRFKANRSSQPTAALFPPPMEDVQKEPQTRSGPPGRTIASTLIERPGTVSAGAAPPPDDGGFDEELQKRQIALEHHRLRNRMIHDQGGYVKGGEAENWGDAYAAPELQDEKTGQPVKISRFKAARMRP